MEGSDDPRGEPIGGHPGWVRVGDLRAVAAGIATGAFGALGFATGEMTSQLRGMLWAVAVLGVAMAVVFPFVVRAERTAALRRARAGLPAWTRDGFGRSNSETRKAVLTGPFRWAKPVGAALATGGMAMLHRRTPDPVSAWAICTGVLSFAAGKLLGNRGGATGRVAWPATPLRAGERATISFRFERKSKAPVVVERLTLTLRCLTARPRWANFRRPEVRCLFEQTVERHDELPTPLEVEAGFDLPPGAPGTDLVAEPAVFWELDVESDGPGFRYRDTFLVPVYARDAAPVTS